MDPLRVAVLGAGGRGYSAYGLFARTYPQLVEVVAVAEPDDAKRRRMGDAHNIPERFRFRTWQELVDKRPPVAAVLNCLQDALHLDSAMAVMKAGYHQLLEKPMATTPHACARIVRAARESGRMLAVCHVLRYGPFFQTVKKVIHSGVIGDIVSGVHLENVSFWHQGHGFVRGPWSTKAAGSPMILQKSCHDLDLLVYLLGKRPARLSSFGSLTYFKPENAPRNAPGRCLDGCPAEPTCPYSVQKNYLGGNRPGWLRDSDHLSTDTSYEGKVKALNTGPMGRCVYKCGNDVVDHQAVNIEFEGGATMCFLMHAFTEENCRTLRYCGTKGEIKGHGGKQEVKVNYFEDGREDTIRPGRIEGGHGGSDTVMMQQFVQAILSNDPSGILTNAEVSLDSHYLAFAAEESRLANGKVIEMSEYRARIESEL